MALNISTTADVAADKTDPKVLLRKALKAPVILHQLGGLEVAAHWATET